MRKKLLNVSVIILQNNYYPLSLRHKIINKFLRKQHFNNNIPIINDKIIFKSIPCQKSLSEKITNKLKTRKVIIKLIVFMKTTIFYFVAFHKLDNVKTS